MSSPRQVDSEISFRLPPNQGEESEAGDVEPESRSMIRQGTATSRPMSGFGEDVDVRETVGSMASILKDVVHELQLLKSTQIQSSKDQSTLGTSNMNNNTDSDQSRNTPGSSGPGWRYSSGDFRSSHDAGMRCQENRWEISNQDERGNWSGRQSRGGGAQADGDLHGCADGQSDQCNMPGRHSNTHLSNFYRGQLLRPGCTQVKFPPFSGKEDWHTWLARFEVIAARYRWTDEERLDQLLPKLEGTAAQFVFTQLSPEVLNDYQHIVYEMNSRFRVIETARSFAAKFSQRTQKPNETVEDYAADLKRLYDKAHGFRDRRTRDEDLVRRFLDGLYDEEISFEVEFNKEPRDIDEAVYYAVNLIQIRNKCRRERRFRSNTKRTYQEDSTGGYESTEGENAKLTNSVKRIPFKPRQDEMGKTQHHNKNRTKGESLSDRELLEKLLKRVERLEGSDSTNNRLKAGKRECFACHREGHFIKECPFRSTRNNQDDGLRTMTDTRQSKLPLNDQGPALAAKGRSN